MSGDLKDGFMAVGKYKTNEFHISEMLDTVNLTYLDKSNLSMVRNLDPFIFSPKYIISLIFDSFQVGGHWPFWRG